MSKKTRFRSLPSAEFSIAVAQSGAKAELKINDDLTAPSEPTPEPAPAPEPTPEPEPEPTPTDPRLKVEITANRTTATASASIFFEAQLTGFDKFAHPRQDALIVWNFGDPGSKFADLSGRLDMLHKMDPTQKRWNDANVGYGFLVAHVYRKPGTYQVYADVYHSLDEAPVRSNTVTVTAEDPDVVFGNARTVYASSTNDFAGVPTGAKTIVTSDAKAAMLAVGAPRRVLFKRGDKFSAPAGTPGQYPKTLIGAWGDPAKPRPVIDATNSGFGLGSSELDTEVIIKDIDIVGPMSMAVAEDNATQTGSGIGNTANGFYTYDNVRAPGCRIGLSGMKGFENREAAAAYIDCEVSDWVDYGVYGKWPLVAFLGTYVHGRIDAFQYNSNSGGGSAHRIEAFGIGGKGGAYFCCCDCYMNYAGRFTGHQPGYKVQGDSNLDTKWVWDRIITEGSTDTSHGVGSTTPDRQFALIDKHIHIGTANCGLPLSIQQGGTTVRNFFYVLPHVANEKLDIKSISNNYQVNNEPGSTTAENKAAWFYTYGCTALLWADVETHTNHGQKFRTTASTSSFADTRVSNNIVHVPWDRGGPQLSDVDTSAGATGIAFYPGRKDYRENGGKLQTQYATPQKFSFSKLGVSVSEQPTVCVARPLGANLTADKGTGDLVPFDYIDGTLRGRNPAKGAFKP